MEQQTRSAALVVVAIAFGFGAVVEAVDGRYLQAFGNLALVAFFVTQWKAPAAAGKTHGRLSLLFAVIAIVAFGVYWWQRWTH